MTVTKAGPRPMSKHVYCRDIRFFSEGVPLNTWFFFHQKYKLVTLIVKSSNSKYFLTATFLFEFLHDQLAINSFKRDTKLIQSQHHLFTEGSTRRLYWSLWSFRLSLGVKESAISVREAVHPQQKKMICFQISSWLTSLLK